MKEKLMVTSFPWRLALSLYLLAYGLVFTFLESYFWDDWTAYFTKSNREIAQGMRERGDWPTRAFLESTILRNEPALFRVFTLFCYFLCGWLLYRILSTLKFLNLEQTKLITFLFLVGPINSARFAMVVFAYAFSLLLFYVAWFLLTTKTTWLTNLFAIVLFVLSFGATASLLVFYALPCIHRLYLGLTQPKFRLGKELFFSLILLSVSPVYWFLDRQFNSPQDQYLQSYSLQRSGVFRALLLMVICTVICVWYLRVGRRNSVNSNRYLLISIGLISIMIGAAPYIVAGHLVDVSEWMLNFVPRASDWSSRHQLLLGLGIGILVTGVLGELNSLFKKQLSIVIIGVCVLLNLTYMHSYFLDSLKQNEFIAAISKSSELNSAKVILIDDQAVRFNARDRVVRPFEWDAMFAISHEDDTKRTISGLSYVHCTELLIPDTLLTITASHGRLKATLLRDIGLNIEVTQIDPCS